MLCFSVILLLKKLYKYAIISLKQMLSEKEESMSFKKIEFMSYLKGKGLKSVRTYCSYLRRIEGELKSDIDIEYDRDGCITLFENLETRLEKAKPISKKEKNKKPARQSKISATKRKYNSLRQMRNVLNKYLDFRRCDDIRQTLIPKEVEEKLSRVDWSVNDVMVGTVRDSRQLEFIMKHNGYYAPALFIPDQRLPIRYIALHEQGIGTEPGIHLYGEVLTAQRIKRSRIPVPMSRNNGDEPYYYFQVRKWEVLSHSVLICDTSRGQPLFTNRFLLENATHSYQLFSINSENDFRLMAVINRAFVDIRNAEQQELCRVYPINEAVTLSVSNEWITVINSKGKDICRIPMSRLFYRPRDSFEKLKKCINKK